MKLPSPSAAPAAIDRVLTRDRPRLLRHWLRLSDTSRGDGSAARQEASSPAQAHAGSANDDDESARDTDGSSGARGEARFAQELAAAEQRFARRLAALPQPTFDGSLPIHAHIEQIHTALRDRQVLIVAGETGSGKSTQLPQILLAGGWGARGWIGHTQPRRIAARSIAARVAEELRVPEGQEVGYKIRFQDRTNPRSFVKLMTDGILLAETQNDRHLDHYEVIILDEAHERSLNIDFLLGYLKQLLPQRPELRLIITSATLDAERFSQHFADAQGPAPIIQVSGRSYPVEIEYRPLINADGDEQPWDEAVVDAVHEVSTRGRGDVLVFLPTERDIREVTRSLRNAQASQDGGRRPEILPLYARLSTQEQSRIFESSTQRRIVLATNVAESSLTVPNIHYVIDTGTARISRYSPRTKMLRLPIEPVSRASADQRAGRCGRIAPGICLRLYDEADYLRRDAYTTPEIRRTNLAGVILQAKALRLGEIEDYPFLDPPHPEAIRDGYKTLYELGAIDARRELTAVGRRLAQMPVDPRIGRMIMAGADERCLADVLIVAACLEIQDPRERPHDRQQQADECHAQFLDKESDFISLLKLWDFYHHLRETVSRNQLRKACQQNFLSYNRLREWTELHRQLMDVAARQGWTIGPRREEFTPLHRALLAGLLSGVGLRTSEGDYLGGGGVKYHLWPGSGVIRQRPQWIVAAERVETSRRYARTVSRISPQWIETLAQHLVKRSYSDPHWHRKANTVMAFEKVSLQGIPVVVQRRVGYGPIDPATSRKIFLQSALVDGQMDATEKVLQHNREIRDEIQRLAAKTRRRDWVLDDYVYYAFYDQRLPADVFDLASLRRWLKQPAHRNALTMQLTDFISLDEESPAVQAFPEQLQIGPLALPVEYHFQPGSEADGVTLTVPAGAVQQLRAEQLGWLVPGLLEEKTTALIRSLPKALRRNFVPVPDTARDIVRRLSFGEGNLLESLARELSHHAQERVRPEDFDLEKLPPHLRVNLRVIDDSGEVRAMGRDLEHVRQALGPIRGMAQAEAETASSAEWHRDQLTTWDFGDLPRQITRLQAGIEVPQYPALLVESPTTVCLRLLDSAARADRHTRRALARLYAAHQKKSLRHQIRWLPRWNEILVWSASWLSTDSLQEGLQIRLADQAFLGNPREGLPRTAEEFQARMERAVERIAMATQELAPILPQIFQRYHEARLALEQLSAKRDPDAHADLRQQWTELVRPDVMTEVPWFWWQQIPRYFHAMVYRIERLQQGGSARDREQRAIVGPYWQRYCQRRATADPTEPEPNAWVEFRWMIEELRVSLFAQPLGTAVKVSPQRLDKLWAAAQAAGD